MSLREVLELPSVLRGRPRVRAGSAALGAEVRWVHVSELPDVAGTLTGGELVLQIGVVLSEAGTDLVRYLDSLRASGAVGLVVELGRHVERLPEELVQYARSVGFPLVELRSTVRFVEITEAVHGRVMHEQFARLDLTRRAHRVLGPLGVEGAPVEVILARCAELVDRAVVLEDLSHRVIGFAGASAPEDILRDWTARSRQVPPAADTIRGGPERWMAIPVGLRRARWGRLVVPTRVDQFEAEDVALVLERAAEAVTITRLVGGPAEELEVMAVERLIRDVIGGHGGDEAAVGARAQALGFSPAGEIAVLMARGRGGDGGPDAELVEQFGAAVHRIQRTALVGRVRRNLVVALLDGGDGVDDRLASELGAGAVAVLALGPPVRRWRELAEALTEAEQIAGIARPTRPGEAVRVSRGRHLGVRRLLWQLRGEVRLHAFVDEQLGRVLALPHGRREDTLRMLESYLDCNGVMAVFARSLHLSRAGAYARLDTLRRVLGADLGDAEVRTGLHLAMLAHRAATGDQPAPTPP
ncbi:putative regulatory protein [Pseudonocardia sp. Ae406_Ps2]|uniref:PucR family transcriptional regulator n=1 Tax=unclassified Pseudonocardia TaxID=2619320 RepID=UPI00094AD7FE|nr:MULTISPECIES: PucR family transcriptional regulator [unclassified Pseudonocardia]OLM00645.1 putative regulatory protein [Pseudonocardia sp. Ae406_Ps2]OLM07565.1 putative regulatory protein [Pseudonocardia sp. Ae331_Ps2]OLM14752.1 putative regulatory protein [Pseudonocardia sp. Ae505_Ps2]OLM22217.1 putative regulatory protein [Pseudonocardia sp. Ae706_Ps2]OLM31902.1 putative regulatory protein [Pseudonocardia sp. Ae717_Ps2]